MAVLYAKPGAVKLSKMLVKIKHASAVELLKLLTRYNETALPVDYKDENGQQYFIQLTPGACSILRPVRPV